MKLILCPTCGDVIRLREHTRQCFCRLSWGRYLPDGENAEIGWKAIPLGFVDDSLTEAVRKRPESGKGERFVAFVIPRTAPRVKVAR